MTLDELRQRAAELLPPAVRNAVEHPEQKNQELAELKSLCWTNFESMGFVCMADCFAATLPRIEGRLDLARWSSAELSILPWTLRVTCRPFYLSSTTAHFEIRHDGPLPGVTETGYRSVFAPMSAFADRTPDDFIRSVVCKNLPKSAQMTLF